jgi:hypothetical protein
MKLIINYKDGHSEDRVLECGCKLPRTLKEILRMKDIVNMVTIMEL